MTLFRSQFFALLEQVRTLLNKPIMINSGFRSKPVNDSVGSKDTSQHRIGCAADIRVPGMTPMPSHWRWFAFMTKHTLICMDR